MSLSSSVAADLVGRGLAWRAVLPRDLQSRCIRPLTTFVIEPRRLHLNPPVATRCPLVGHNQRTPSCSASIWRTHRFGSQSPSGDGSSGQPERRPSKNYSAKDINEWRSNFGFAKRQHSIAVLGYTDDELLDWRQVFDELACDGRIERPSFERLVEDKYRGIVPDEQLKQKLSSLWHIFDKDDSGSIDFGEFIGVGLLFDLAWAKEKIRQDGIDKTWRIYSEDEYMVESHILRLVEDFHFFVITATDVRKIISWADRDGDGLLSFNDFSNWVVSEDNDIFRVPSKRRVRVPLPPRDPDDDD